LYFEYYTVLYKYSNTYFEVLPLQYI
jgi:hypothetical protein